MKIDSFREKQKDENKNGETQNQKRKTMRNVKCEESARNKSNTKYTQTS